MPATVASSYNDDDSSSFYFRPHRQPPKPAAPPSTYRSFLSLDVADSVLSRSSSRLSTASSSTASSFFPTPVTPTPPPQTRPRAYPATGGRTPTSPGTRVPAPHPPPRTPVPPVPQARQQQPPQRAPSTSTVSTGYRRTKRNDALARLEGRPNTAHGPASRAAPNTGARPRDSYNPYLLKSYDGGALASPQVAMSFWRGSSSSDEFWDEEDERAEVAVAPRTPVSPRPRAGTIESWYAGPPPPLSDRERRERERTRKAVEKLPKNFMDFGI